MFKQLLANEHNRLGDSKFGREEVWVWSLTKRKKKKIKQHLGQEQRSAHGCAVKNPGKLFLTQYINVGCQHLVLWCLGSSLSWAALCCTCQTLCEICKHL